MPRQSKSAPLPSLTIPLTEIPLTRAKDLTKEGEIPFLIEGKCFHPKAKKFFLTKVFYISTQWTRFGTPSLAEGEKIDSRIYFS